MVRLTRIYTRGGDGGETSLGDGRRVAKHDLRVAAFGTVDEANAAIGLARLHLAGGGMEPGGMDDEDAMLARIQNDLFDLGADLCRPAEGWPEETMPERGVLRIVASQVARLEAEIDFMNATLQPLNSFVLPGGKPAAAYLHLARTITRRAERLVGELRLRETVNDEAFKYLNRLSDHLFVLSRRINDQGAGDVLWRPGATR